MYTEAIDSARVHLIKDVAVVQGRKVLSMIGSHVSADHLILFRLSGTDYTLFLRRIMECTIESSSHEIAMSVECLR